MGIFDSNPLQTFSGFSDLFSGIFQSSAGYDTQMQGFDIARSGLDIQRAGIDVARQGLPIQQAGIDLQRQGAQFALQGSNLQAGAIRQGIIATQQAADFNIQIDRINTNRVLEDINTTAIGMIHGQVAQAGGSGFTVNSRSFLAINSDTLGHYERLAQQTYVDNINKERSITYESQVQQTMLENKARATEYQGQVQNYLTNRSADISTAGLQVQANDLSVKAAEIDNQERAINNQQAAAQNQYSSQMFNNLSKSFTTILGGI